MSNQYSRNVLGIEWVSYETLKGYWRTNGFWNDPHCANITEVFGGPFASSFTCVVQVVNIVTSKVICTSPQMSFEDSLEWGSTVLLALANHAQLERANANTRHTN